MASAGGRGCSWWRRMDGVASGVRNSSKGEVGKAVRQDKEQLPDASSDITKMERQAVDARTANCMYLFGDFPFFDRSGRNISYMFSLRIKQIFCLILRYSDANGILPNN